MIKKIFIYLLLCIISCVAVGCTKNTTPALSTDEVSATSSTSTQSKTPINSGDDKTMTKIKIYGMDREAFFQFIENPSNNSLQGITANVYPDDGEVFFRGTVSPFIVNSSLINFAGDLTELKKYLSQNGITGNIENTAMIYYTPQIPMTIWVKTNQGDFFITVDEVIPDLNNLPSKTNDWYAEYYSYVYTFYKQSDYCAKFKPSKTQTTSDGKLIVNGKDITNGNHIKINYEYLYAELPFTAVVTALGAKVEWSSKTIATITFGGKDFILDTAKVSFTEVGGGPNAFIIPPGTAHGIHSQIIGDEFVIDSDSARGLIVNMMGAKIDIDYERAIVKIEQ